jgi:Family of unknown function (DUF5856)
MTEYAHFLFELQTTVKLYHWNTSSFSRHRAADELFDALLDLSDKFMEIYIGKYSRPRAGGRDIQLNIRQLDDKEMTSYLKESVRKLHSLSAGMSELDTDLTTIVDELLGKLNQTLYLFTLR